MTFGTPPTVEALLAGHLRPADGSALRRQVRRQLIDDFARGSQQLRRF